MNIRTSAVYRPYQPAGPTRADRERFVYTEIAPSPALRTVVYCYFVLSISPQRNKSALYHAIPDGCIDFVIDTKVNMGSVLVSTLHKSAHLTVGPHDEFFGIRFLPAQINRLARIPSRELADSVNDTEDVLGKTLAEFSDRLFECHSLFERVRFCDSWLTDRLGRAEQAIDRRLQGALDLIYASAGRAGLEEVAASAELGSRQLRRLFHANLGASPKQFARLVRFQQHIRLLHEIPKHQWPTWISDSYYDQSHFYREFLALYGYSLSEYQP